MTSRGRTRSVMMALIGALGIAIVACGGDDSGGGVACGNGRCAVGQTCCNNCGTPTCGPCTAIPCALPDASTDASHDASTQDAPVDAGACPASCTTSADCATCPTQGFGGWSCGAGGVCQFMG